MPLSYAIVDVFTDKPLQGNQLAVFEDGSTLTGDVMQRLAREMNLSETVFLLPAEHGGDVLGRASSPQRPSCPSPGILSSERPSSSVRRASQPI